MTFIIYLIATVALVVTGWTIGKWFADKRYRSRMFELYDVFDEQDRETIG